MLAVSLAQVWFCRADSPSWDSTSYPFVGIAFSHYTASNPPQNINVVAVDLSAPGIRFFVTPKVPGILPYTVRRQYTPIFCRAGVRKLPSTLIVIGRPLTATDLP